MLNWIIDTSLRYRFAVLALVLAAAAAGAYSLAHIDIDAFPDTTPVQVQINTVTPALSPVAVEQQVTFPIEQALSGLPKLEAVRSVSKFGFSQVTVIDDDLGRSGSGLQDRPGFSRLLACVCQGLAGAVLALEASRLARNVRSPRGRTLK